jgi:hypothetical protein
MAYCVKCGVELADKEPACPLCQTPVLLPETMQQEQEGRQGHALYPERDTRSTRQRKNLVPSWPVVLLVSLLLLIPFLVTGVTDFRANGRITWSFYPMASLMLLWLMVAYPALLKRHTIAVAFTVDMLATAAFLVSLDLYADGRLAWSWYPASALVLVWLCVMLPFWLVHRPVLMTVVYFVVVSGFLWLMEWVTGSGPWFLPLAMPLTAAVSLCGFGIWVAFRHIRGRFASLSLMVLLLTLLLAAIDVLIRYFQVQSLAPVWSPLAAAVGLPLSALLLAIHRSAELRNLLQKKFHL